MKALTAKIEEGTCPYRDGEAGVCGASLSRMTIGAMVRENYCEDERYDACALFLAKILMRR